MTRNLVEFAKKNRNRIVPLLPLIAFDLPLFWLYLLNPESFEIVWKGRAFQLFFVWLILLELILGWEQFQTSKLTKLNSRRSAFLIVALLLPSIYVVISNYAGLSTALAEASKQSGIYWWNDVPVATEYLVLALLFSVASFALFGAKGVKDFLVPILFATFVGAIFMMDSIYPYEQFTPFQILVPTTTALAAGMMSLMGYTVTLSSLGNLPHLTVTDPINPVKTASFAIAWPCAGIESLLLFSVVIVLFLKRMPISWKAKVSYFGVGAVVTYFINVLRIVSIFLFTINGGDTNLFHSTYGPLPAITWIVSYPLIILGSQSLWHKIKSRNEPAETAKEPLAEPKSEASV